MAKRLAIILFLLIAAIAWFYWEAFSPHSYKATQISDCPAGFLDNVESCEGEGVTGFQNSGEYYFIARGKPRVKDCKAIQEAHFTEVSKPATKIDTPQLSEWHHDDCALFPNLKNSKCFSFDRLSSNGNAHYYMMAAFSGDCERAIFFSASQREPSYFVEKIRY
jgi:hypothetical protein